MERYFVFTDYLNQAMAGAEISRLEDGTYCGIIPGCAGVISIGKGEVECIVNLQSVLESWVLLRVKMGHVLPQIRGINLNQEPVYEHSYSM